MPVITHRLYFLVTLFFTLASLSASAQVQRPLTLKADAAREVISLTPYLDYAVDSDAHIQVEQLYNNPQVITFQPVASQSIPTIREVIWYRLIVNNEASVSQSWVINFDELLIDELEVYYKKSGQLVSQKAGLNFPVYDRSIDYRFIAIPIELEPKSLQVIYFRLKSSHIPLIAPTLSTELAFATQVSSATIINLLFIGMGIGLCLFMAIFMPLAITRRESFSFISYLILTTLVIISVSGFFQYVFPDKPEWHKFLLVALLAANSISNLLMVNTFFGIHLCNPRVNKLYWLFGLGFSAFIWGYDLFGRFEALMVPLIGYTLFMFVLLLGTSVLKYFQGSAHAGLFIIAKVMFFITCLYSALGAEGIMPYNTLIRHGIGSGIILQAAIICLAMAKKVSAEKAHAAELEKNIAIARAASRDKSEFLATMSHEVRTPMNGVLGMAQMLEKTPLNEEQHRYTQVILNSGKTLLAVINDILDFSKIEAGKMHLEYRSFDLQSIINDTHALFLPVAEEKQLDFKVSIADDCPTMLMGDPIRLQQVVNNLLSNAFKFTDRGFVALAISFNHKNQNEAQLLFKVKDTGIGISYQKQRELFQAFTQAHRSTTRSYGGTGLGLAISKQLVGMMEGEIGIHSNENEGAEFWFTANFSLLLENYSDVESSLLSTEESQNTDVKSVKVKQVTDATKPVLVAEDNQVNQQVVRAMLSKAGLDMVLAEDGGQALDLFQHDLDGYCAVLMDLEMPVKNGYQTTDEIRSLEAQQSANSPVPIIALTAHVLENNLSKCYDSGMDAVLKKPLQLPELIETLEQLEVI